MEIPAVDESTHLPDMRLFWRPGCPYCTRLRRGLARRGVTLPEVNIWQDPAAAAAVRAVTGGSETVPTVVVGDRALVNPSPAAVLAAVEELAPGSLSAARPPSRVRVVRVAQWMAVAVCIAVSELVSRGGHPDVGYIFDGLAFASYRLVGRLAR